MNDPLPRRYSTAEVAKCYGVPPRTVVGWIKAGKLSAVRLGRTYYTTAEALKAMEKEAHA